MEDSIVTELPELLDFVGLKKKKKVKCPKSSFEPMSPNRDFVQNSLDDNIKDVLDTFALEPHPVGDDLSFDSMKKKKKKKVVNFDEIVSNLSTVTPEPNPVEEGLIFDSMKKKKKKKLVSLDEIVTTLGTITQEPNPLEDDLSFDSMAKEKKKAVSFDEIVSTQEPNPDEEGPVEDDLGFDNMKKKKKKVVSFDEIVSTPESNPVEDGPVEDDLSFDNMKKKKKKKVVSIDEISSTASNTLSFNSSTLLPVDNEGDDYTYDDLLTRIYSLLREKDPNRDTENRKKLVLKPPQVIRIGTKKTSFVNFLEISKLMHRTPQHLQSFLLAELGTTASVDGNNQLIIKGRFEQRQIESVLRRYIKEYVTCHTCKSPDTVLQKDTRLFFLQCESCGSRCSVASVKSGFQAVTGKRAAMRAKAT